jgi:hypothetical protein
MSLENSGFQLQTMSAVLDRTPQKKSSFLLTNPHQISLDLNLEFCLVFTMFFPPWVYFCHLLIFLIHGRFAGYLPTISETGVGPFGHMFQYKCFATISLTSLYTGLAITWFVFGARPTAKRRNSVALFTVVIGSLAMLVTGCASMVDHHSPHFLSAGGGLALMVVWQCVVYQTLMPGMTVAQKVSRVCYIAAQAIGLVAIERSDHLLCHRVSITVATIAEYAVVFFLQCFYLSFFGDIRRWRPVLVMA